MTKELPCVCTYNFPHAIVHVDMDSFFASCEQQRDPSLRSKPVVIGKERGIATSMSAEAKKAGVTRGMKAGEIKRVCPECLFLPSDYETFGLYSIRLYDIVRRYSADVEEYSVDECFADITSMRRALNMSYEKIVENIKHDIDTELGTVCSIGLAPSKVTAKIASGWRKPNGMEIIPGRKLQYYLREVPIGKIWGVGKAREQFFQSRGIHTALDLAYKPKWWIEEELHKPEQELWFELRGIAVKALQTESIDEYRSISKRKTFVPASNNYDEVFSRLCKNIENACIKARRYRLASAHASFSLTSQNFLSWGGEVTLDVPTANPIPFIKHIRPLFEKTFNSDVYYRRTWFCLHGLSGRRGQGTLFAEEKTYDTSGVLMETLDAINSRYGKHTVRIGETHKAIADGDYKGDRGERPWREKKENMLPGETGRRRVNIPFCGWVK